MICPHCGSENKQGEHFCTECGAQLVDNSSTVTVTSNGGKGPAAGLVTVTVDELSTSCAPHSVQKCSPCLFSVPQCGQIIRLKPLSQAFLCEMDVDVFTNASVFRHFNKAMQALIIIHHLRVPSLFIIPLAHLQEKCR